MGTYPAFEGVAVAAYNRMREELKQRAMKTLRLPESEIVVRPLRAEDLELTTPRFIFNLATPGTVGYKYMTGINTVSIADNRFVGINGICYANGTPAINQLKIDRAGSTARVWNIQEAFNNENNAIWFDDPVTINQNETLTIYQYCSGATTDTSEEVIFLGVVAEKRGIVTNP